MNYPVLIRWFFRFLFVGPIIFFLYKICRPYYVIVKDGVLIVGSGSKFIFNRPDVEVPYSVIFDWKRTGFEASSCFAFSFFIYVMMYVIFTRLVDQLGS